MRNATAACGCAVVSGDEETHAQVRPRKLGFRRMR
jgi:hypothetical protein